MMTWTMNTILILSSVLIAIRALEDCHITNNQPVVALILARGGSKGIPLKNIAKLNGQSLLQRSLEVIQKVGSFEKIWVSTDHPLIVEEAEKFNASVFHRSDEFAKDESSSIGAVQEFLRSHPYEKLALIQCTSPFIREELLREALRVFQEGADCVFSVQRSHAFRWQISEGADKFVTPINLDPLNRPRRQDWPGELVENGMFYMATRDLIMHGNTFQSDRCRVVEIPPEDGLQIDTPFDLKMAEFILQERFSP